MAGFGSGSKSSGLHFGWFCCTEKFLEVQTKNQKVSSSPVYHKLRIILLADEEYFRHNLTVCIQTTQWYIVYLCDMPKLLVIKHSVLPHCVWWLTECSLHFGLLLRKAFFDSYYRNQL